MKKLFISIIMLMLCTVFSFAQEAKDKAVEDLYWKTFYARKDASPQSFEIKVLNEPILGIGKGNPWLFKKERDIKKLVKEMKINDKNGKLDPETIKQMYLCILESQLGKPVTIAYYSFLFDSKESLKKSLPVLTNHIDKNCSALIVHDQILVIFWTDDDWSSDKLGLKALDWLRNKTAQRMKYKQLPDEFFDQSSPEKTWDTFKQLLQYRDFFAAYNLFSEEFRSKKEHSFDNFVKGFSLNTQPYLQSEIVKTQKDEEETIATIKMHYFIGRDLSGNKIEHDSDMVLAFIPDKNGQWSIDKVMKKSSQSLRKFYTHNTVIRIGNALRAYKTSNGSYPKRQSKLYDAVKNGLARGDAEGEMLVDKWGSQIVYKNPDSNDGQFQLYSIGKNKIDEGGAGDDINYWLLVRTREK